MPASQNAGKRSRVWNSRAKHALYIKTMIQGWLIDRLPPSETTGRPGGQLRRFQLAGADRNITEVGEWPSGTQWLILLSYCILSYSATMRRLGAPLLRHGLKPERAHTLMTNRPRSDESREGPIISLDRCICCPRHHRSWPCKQLGRGALCHLTTHQHLSKTICAEWPRIRIVKTHQEQTLVILPGHMCGRPLRSPDTEGHLFQFKLLSASLLIRWDVAQTAHAHSNQFIYRLQTEMTSWFNLIVSNRIIHGNKLPKWGYTLPKSFNNDGNHGHDVSQYYFIIGFSPCICQLGLASGWAQLVSRLTHSC